MAFSPLAHSSSTHLSPQLQPLFPLSRALTQPTHTVSKTQTLEQCLWEKGQGKINSLIYAGLQI